jgi:antitoxin (DNA-binding transcriptional repressor) of toxin-antitoxin stability system
MTTMTIVEARSHLADAINRVSYGGERIGFARRGKLVAGLVSAEELALLQRLEDEADMRAVRVARRDYAKHGGVALEDAIQKARRGRRK